MEIIGYEGTPDPNCPLTFGATAIRDGDEVINGVLGWRSPAEETLEKCRDSLCMLPVPIIIPKIYGLIVPLYDDIVGQVVRQVENDSEKDGVDKVGVWDEDIQAYRRYVLAVDKPCLDAWIAKVTEKLDEYIELFHRAYNILDHRRSTKALLKEMRQKVVQMTPSAGGRGDTPEGDWVEFRRIRVAGMKPELNKTYSLVIDPGGDS